ncbi:tetratricopeptide repeat protein [Paraburkholderia lycopersici]|uniref:protein O-GlcNAc transferase n=1 Tax=Paraburkholderia lycopersici TaxID=416944 RepID=A0A1G6T5G8_9BURK|nr:tetratricopeptide repeat protein [Paraburkholderia lycopersici]SDD24279.1 Predicted O-linked N-acetylglucosamine transferase, SPINDLY family [Paraburkholderia lycopersici]
MTSLSAPDPTLAAASPQNRDLALVLQAAIAHHQKQEYDEAAALYASIIDAEKDQLDAHYNFGVLLMQTGKPGDAVPHFEAVLGQAPKNGQVWIYYINALVGSQQSEAARLALDLAQQQGLPDTVVRTLRARIDGTEVPEPEATQEKPAAIAPQPAVREDAPPPAEPAEPAETDTDASTRTKLDTRRASLKEMRQFQHLFNNGKIDAALKVARRLTERYPAHGDCWFELGRTLHRIGDHAGAIEAAQHAARLLPDRIGIHITLTNWLYTARRFREVETYCRQALEKFPESGPLHRNLGIALQEMGRYADAVAEIRRAVELAPNSAHECDALANSLLKQGLFEEADTAFRRALELAPMEAITHSNLLFCRMHKYDLDPDVAFAEQREFAARHEVAFRAHPPRHTNDRNPSRCLKIGFVSGDLVNHPVAYFFLSILEHLARDPGLSIHIYSNYAVTDSFTGRIRVHAKTWNEISGMTNDAVAQKIRDDGIDILVDLTGHTGRNRLVAFARKPAPIQASWIGNPCTTGLDSVDYYLSDRFVTPLEQFESRFSEKLVFLPALAPFKPHPKAPRVNELPALKNGFITFGSFSRILKIGPEVVALWARVLREIPDSRMVIGAITSQEQMAKLTGLLLSEGIEISRIKFLIRGSVEHYLLQHHLVDVCLDTFPFGNSTTTMQALWMGVPTMTLPGTSMASRSSTGWLSHLGLDSAFVAQDKDDFVRKCVALAADPQALAVVRRELREYCRQSVLIDARAIADAAARAFRIMWQRWCDGLKPEHFEVLAQASEAPAAEPEQQQEPEPEAVGGIATLPNHIYQIHYSDETREQVEPGFVPLDNTGLRPDWREYWPIRRFLLEEPLDPNARYGFLSPRFAVKTGLTSDDVFSFLSTVPDDVDVVTFSPFFDQAAFTLNVFEHAANVHPNIAPVIDEVLKIVAPDIRISDVIMSSVETIFCNYFVAKPAFWAQWLEKCEQIFELAESGDTPLAQRLNGDVDYERAGVGAAPSKVFIVERIASLILATQPGWKVRQFDPVKIHMSNSAIARFRDELLALDALKHMARATGFSQYLGAYRERRAQLEIFMRGGRLASKT